ncbi:MSMEG_4193 family putative phosphomutase [Aeromicrobium sp. Marseille-Q0843]|uniref:MSMEG_4193 family putative phosphomutase n=1 Tax=Aeromicrobium phoceense TaxID=2754045 RepID=A0A838XGJ1_9ACTN|nr:histidine phosphatase family protein [Aeromicrobium phoceense]MBA4609665.1 MSMEG_4193 family putative phosphomutase [Aeromicrobium phoceense]
MAIVLLVRHGRSTANTSGTLAGRLPDIHLDELGLTQVEATGARLADLSLADVVTSPLERCRETAAAIAGRHGIEPTVDESITECGYGDWQGRALKDLAAEDLWKTVQHHPAAAAFPGGESLAAMQARGVAAIRGHDARIEAEHGAHAVWVAVSHGDVIKAVLADALGMHLDLFQRLHVDPASVSIVRYGARRPDVVAVNTSAGDLSWLRAPATADDAAVGGGAGR